MYQSALRRAKTPLKTVLYLDNDDDTRDKYPKSDENLTRFDEPSRRSAKSFYWLLEKVQTPYFMVAPDDIEFMTDGWDEKLLANMPKDDMALVSGYTTFKNSDGNFLGSMKWHRMIGLFPENAFVHFGPDGWAIDVAKRAGRFTQCRDVIIEHHHFKNKKAEYDLTYQRARSNNDATNAQHYLDANATVRDAHAKLICGEIKRFEKEGK
jgi:hypothetical protein